MTVLSELGGARSWIVAREIHEADGKVNKIPVDPTTGRLFPKDSGGALNPAHWMTGTDAAAWAAHLGPGYWPGLVLHPELKIFCLDLDHCRAPNGGWFPHVLSFLNRFPAALSETSVSDSGRHLFIRYVGDLPAHGVDNSTYQMQGYSCERFILTTGKDSSGSLAPDYTAELTRFLAEFFPEKLYNSAEWTSVPVEEWRGPEDDTELLGRMIRAASPRAIFGSGAAFSDLWFAHDREDVLAKAFPSRNNRDAYDRSGADQALFNHLAFWTGNNCERMLHIARGSQLARQKWLDREHNYLRPTILSSCGSQKEWYKETEAPRTLHPEPAVASDSSPAGSEAPVIVKVEMVGIPVAPPTAPAEATLKPGELPAVGEYCNIHTMRQLFAGMCYVQDIHAMQLPDGTSVEKNRFDSTYGGPQYAMTSDGQKPSKSAWDAYTLSEIYRFPRVETQYFRPGEPTGAIRTREGRREINSYRPAEVRRVPGDPAPFLDLLKRMLPNGNDAKILLCFMAACCQYLGTKFKWAPFIQGTKGNGKTTVGLVLEYCLSQRYTHWAKADQIGEKFNSVFVDKLLVIVDEMYSDDARELQEVLKQMVTATRIETRPMRAEKIMKEICFNMLLFSNHQNGVRIDMDERRYAPLFCAQQTKADKTRDGLTKPYFIELHKWLWEQDGAAIVYDHLMAMQIPDELNPGTYCIEAPETTSTGFAATASLGSVEQELIEAVAQQLEGFRGGWISSAAVDMVLIRCGKDRYIPRNSRKGLVTALGYVPHPSLQDGVCSVPMSDGSMPRLYVLKGHTWEVGYLTPEQVKQGYLEAQKR